MHTCYWNAVPHQIDYGHIQDRSSHDPIELVLRPVGECNTYAHAPIRVRHQRPFSPLPTSGRTRSVVERHSQSRATGICADRNKSIQVPICASNAVMRPHESISNCPGSSLGWGHVCLLTLIKGNGSVSNASSQAHPYQATADPLKRWGHWQCLPTCVPTILRDISTTDHSNSKEAAKDMAVGC